MKFVFFVCVYVQLLLNVVQDKTSQGRLSDSFNKATSFAHWA